MSKYTLPSGMASLETEGGLLSERTYDYPLNRRDLETALREALDELWDLQENRPSPYTLQNQEKEE